ncbi:Zn-dependent oxidoreductase, NADPH:quinone reductase [Pyrinomonas methylaliphatogenes]|jgi:NADPH:quinone reductase-like Zn-dependent oxidoreductase|uniref:Zn-dependent oxidoreductase, NADPH:quinone reductase n=2 Tax=Pyrinomonas methylaliphatogenes TaxID=454194 RepID=A0A0B6WV77_9BACT|nr:Zn-dependent oxidoreductase, NADPH:quinone reductase [Pyrinomonas methylaliphatogenes]
MEMMKAVRIHRFGGPEVLTYEDAPRPQIASDELLVRVHGAGVNPVDWKIREGRLQQFLQHKLPLILGWDFSGVVEEVGSAVEGFKVGDEVYARPDIRRDGAYAEFIAVRAREVALKPKTLDHIHAAAVPLASITAWDALIKTARLEAGQRVLIHAAAGGVGHFAVQFARWRGAYVIGTASAANHDLVRELGANEMIDYRAERFEEKVKDVDVVFDTVGGDVQRRSWGVLKKGGMLVSIVDRPSEKTAEEYGVRAAYVFIEPDAEVLKQVAELIDAGVVKPVVENIFALSEARRAHELSQSGHVRGKIVLRVA